MSEEWDKMRIVEIAPERNGGLFCFVLFFRENSLIGRVGKDFIVLPEL